MIQQTITVVAGAVWVLCASPIANALSPSWWYGMGAILAGLQFFISIFLLPETKYYRQDMAWADTNNNIRKSCTERPPLDHELFEARSWASDMRLYIDAPEWSKATDVLKVRKLANFRSYRK